MDIWPIIVWEFYFIFIASIFARTAEITWIWLIRFILKTQFLMADYLFNPYHIPSIQCTTNDVIAIQSQIAMKIDYDYR